MLVFSIIYIYIYPEKTYNYHQETNQTDPNVDKKPLKQGQTYLIQKINQSPVQTLIKCKVGFFELNPGTSDPSSSIISQFRIPINPQFL